MQVHRESETCVISFSLKSEVEQSNSRRQYVKLDKYLLLETRNTEIQEFGRDEIFAKQRPRRCISQDTAGPMNQAVCRQRNSGGNRNIRYGSGQHRGPRQGVSLDGPCRRPGRCAEEESLYLHWRSNPESPSANTY
jgi:hypothetical protein